MKNNALYSFKHAYNDFVKNTDIKISLEISDCCKAKILPIRNHSGLIEGFVCEKCLKYIDI